MYCYYVDIETDWENLLNKIELDIRKKWFINNQKIIKLITCNRIEFYSENEINDLNLDSRFHKIFWDNELYKRWLFITLWFKSSILWEDAIIKQLEKSLNEYNLDDNIYKLLSKALIEWIKIRTKFDFFAKNHWLLALDLLKDNNLLIQNIVILWTWQLVKEMFCEIEKNFNNINIITRHKKNAIKSYWKTIKYFNFDEYINYYFQNNEKIILLIATNNIDDDYIDKINKLINSNNVSTTINLNSNKLEIKTNKTYYIDLYSQNMLEMINKSNLIMNNIKSEIIKYLNY